MAEGHQSALGLRRAGLVVRNRQARTANADMYIDEDYHDLIDDCETVRDVVAALHQWRASREGGSEMTRRQ